MTHLFILPFIAMACIYLVVIANLPYKVGLRFKPFNCESCLTWWISLFYLILHTDPFQAIILAGAAAYLTVPLKRLL